MRMAGLMIAGVLLTIILFFVFLNWLSARTYRPSKEDVRRILQASLGGRLDIGSFDEFSSVPIRYDLQLDEIRRRYNAIVEDPAHFQEGDIAETNATPLNERGRAQLRELLADLQRLPDIGGPSTPARS
jgi:hypothetical protein